MRKLYHVVNALPPVTNAFAGTVTSGIINIKNWNHCSFIIQCGTGATGTAQITVEACSDNGVTPASTVPIPFYYQECTQNDTFGQITQAPTSGFTTSASANKVYKVEVDSQMLASTGFNYVRLKSTEVVTGSITGGIIAVLTEGRYVSEIPDSVLV